MAEFPEVGGFENWLEMLFGWSDLLPINDQRFSSGA